MDFRHRLLDLIDRTGVSDRNISRLATGSKDTVLRRPGFPSRKSPLSDSGLENSLVVFNSVRLILPIVALLFCCLIDRELR